MKPELIDGELVLHGDVGDMFFDEQGLTASGVRSALLGLSGDLSVKLNSGGGSATEGAAIHSVLKSYAGKVTVYVEGIAASAASLLAMAADELVMTQGSLLMIHDPSGMTFGTAEDHQQTAEALDKMADEYAAIYAGFAGISREEARVLMKEELWMGGEEAVERGFATRVEAASDEEEMMVAAFPYHEYQAAPERLVAMAKSKNWGGEKPSPMAGNPVEQLAPKSQNQKEPVMADPKKPEPDKAPEAPKVAEMTDKQKATLAADERRTVVMTVAEGLTAAEVEKIVAESSDPADAKMKAVDLRCEKRMADEPTPTKPSRATVTDDEGERTTEAMIGALQHRMFGVELAGQATQYRGLSMKRLAIDLAGGVKHGMSDEDLVRAGMRATGRITMAGGQHSTSDFTYLTAETMNRQLRADYASRPGTWRRISSARTASDFRTLYSTQFGADVGMKKVNEAGEYEGTVLTDDGESYRVIRYGREIHLTFELVVNDDMSALSRLPLQFARGATNRESSVCWGLINANANMSDGVAFFSSAASRANLATAGGAISVTTVGAARKAMWEQRPLGAVEGGDDFIEAEPNLLYVPPALELAALQFTAVTNPEQDSTTNPFKTTLTPVVEPRLGAAVTGGSDTAWYLFDESLPPIEHAFLDGFEAPRVVSDETMNPKGVTLMAEMVFGAGLVEFRGSHKNPGA